MSARSITIAGALLGAFAGVVAAFVIPQTRAGHSPRRTTTVPVGPTHVLRVGAPLTFGSDIELQLHGRVRVEARVKDPLGGPDWAVRVFRADRVTRPGIRRPGVSPVIGHDVCAQLGRIHDGRFGWLDAQGTFRPMLHRLGGTTWCGSRTPDVHGDPWFDTLSTITEPARPAARVKSTIAWGIAGSAARRISFRLGGRRFQPRRTPHGAFLEVVAGERQPDERDAVIRYADGHVVRAPRPSPPLFGNVRMTRSTLAARAPDPNGGLPFALVARRTSDGRWCTFTGPRVVGDRSGGVDYLLDVLHEVRSEGGGGCTQAGNVKQLFRDHPVLLTSFGGTGPTPGEGADLGGVGRVARRTQPGVTTFGGIVSPGVVSVTLETPRDVRTLVPTGPAHAIIAVYDGSFPTGAITIIARFRDGHTQRQEVPEMPF